MSSDHAFSRRSFLALPGIASMTLATAAKRVPVGLELYSVRDEFAKAPEATVRAVAKMGYETVEFFAPYFNWTADQAKDMRKVMDDAGIRCNSTHNNAPSFTDEGLPKAIELNQILGSKYVVMASAGKVAGLNGWERVADQLSGISHRLAPAGLRTGYHNHQTEFTVVEGKRPIEVIAANTPKEVMLQLDVGTAVEAGSDPVEWIKANPGRIRCVHCKDWAPGPDKGYRVLFGEGDSPWARIFEAAESVGGVEYYLIEQEGSRFPPLETAERCLANWKKLKA
ncbi:MAG: sugar phosphate isomerase/epimerase [Bryobacteraceae bacterium]